MALKLAVIGGDGIGPEVTAEALAVLAAAAKATGLAFTTTDFPFGADHFIETGHCSAMKILPNCGASMPSCSAPWAASPMTRDSPGA